MTTITDIVAAAIKSAADINRPREDDDEQARTHGVVAINALHTAVTGIASRLGAADPSFDSRAFIRACGTAEV